jgi:hypothetical protein
MTRKRVYELAVSFMRGMNAITLWFIFVAGVLLLTQD